MTGDFEGYRRLASAVLVVAVDDALRRGPTSGDALREWRRNKADAIDWLMNPARSRVWCEGAGWDWEMVAAEMRARLERRGENVRRTNRSGNMWEGRKRKRNQGGDP